MKPPVVQVKSFFFFVLTSEKKIIFLLFLAVSGAKSQPFLVIFAYFWILEAVTGNSKETIVGIKVVYGTNKHIRSVSCEKWSRCGYFVAVIPFLTAAFLEIAVSRDFCVFLDFGGR